MKKVEVSVIIPCMNEEKTIGKVLKKVKKAFSKNKIKGEIIVPDTSTDKSPSIARKLGAKVVDSPVRGYGNAYLVGFKAAKGDYIVMGDADNTYDFEKELPKFVKLLREGNDFVNGNRFKGKMQEGAMPPLHKYLGNPLLTNILNVLFGLRLGDVHCGLKAFKRKHLGKMNLQTAGMEFASEIMIAAAKNNLKMTEVPIDYFKRGGESKLSSFRDGWRHLRFMLMFSPKWTFSIPGWIFIVLGGFILLMLSQGLVQLGNVTLGPVTTTLGSLLLILGIQLVFMNMMSNKFLSAHYNKENPATNLEKMIGFGALLILIGIVINSNILLKWINGNMGDLSFGEINTSILSLTTIVAGILIIFQSFILSLFDIKVK